VRDSPSPARRIGYNPPMSPAQTTEENIAKLKAKLRELFQLDRGDLDFGLYRIRRTSAPR